MMVNALVGELVEAVAGIGEIPALRARVQAAGEADQLRGGVAGEHGGGVDVVPWLDAAS
jgi:hypothetical protein